MSTRDLVTGMTTHGLESSIITWLKRSIDPTEPAHQKAASRRLYRAAAEELLARDDHHQRVTKLTPYEELFG